jgi:hypothetical protein
VLRAGGVILRSFLLYKPMQVYGALGAALLVLGSVPFARYGWFLAQGEGNGHVQSLVIGSALWFVGGQMFITGLLAVAIGWNRRMMQEVLVRMKEERADAAAQSRRTLTNRPSRRLATIDTETQLEERRIEDAA